MDTVVLDVGADENLYMAERTPVPPKAAALSNIREAILLCLEVRRADGLAPVVETPGLIAREIQQCGEDRAADGLPLTIETQQVDVEVEVAA